MQRLWTGVAATVACAFLLMGRGTAQAQGARPKFVKATATAPKTVAPGATFTVTVAITVEKPYHIQGNPAKQDYIPTEVKIGPASGFKVGKITYPKPIQAKAGGEMLPVYEGTVQVKAAVTAEKSVKAGSVSLPVTVHYQGCNETACFPPADISTKAALTVKAGGKPVASGGKKKVDAHAGTWTFAQAGGYDGTLILAQAQEPGTAPTAKPGGSQPGTASNGKPRGTQPAVAPTTKPGGKAAATSVTLPGF